ncbi:MAG: helix-turn-helix transcriptional regulator [Pseudomonadota bacterium]
MAEDYLTTKELAALLRIKERKVYDLAATGAVPCSKAMGKLLFPRAEIEQWIADGKTRAPDRRAAPAPDVFLGSHDPLLEWAIRESDCGLATHFDSSLDGLARFARREGIASGLHLRNPETAQWNVDVVGQRFQRHAVVLVGWTERRRGLVMRPEFEGKVAALADIRGLRVVPRQQDAGAQQLLDQMLSEIGLTRRDLTLLKPARSEADAVLRVSEGDADVTFSLEAVADQFRLPFVPVVDERFDLLVDRRSWFEPPLQRLMQFTGTRAFRQRAKSMAGIDISELGTVRFNSA